MLVADAPMTPLPEVEALCEQLDDEPGHPQHVRRIAAAFFALTRMLHGLDSHSRRLLEAAALLHDTGHRHGPEDHHKASRDIILQQQVPGFGEESLRIVACVARYHRGKAPNESHKVYCDLQEDDQQRVQKLAALLRIADGLDRSHASNTQALEAAIGNGQIALLVHQRTPNEIDLWGANRKRALFEMIFACRLSIRPAR